MSNPVDIKIAHINKQDQNKGSLDKDKVFEVFQRNINEVLKGLYRLQQDWVNRSYLNFNDFDTYLILMYLMNKVYVNYSDRFHFMSLDAFYSQDKVGIENAVDHIKKFGFSEEDLPKNGGLALGAGSASPLDMAQAYSVFANGGYKIEPYIIETIRDSENRVVYRNDAPTVCERCEMNPSISEMNIDLIQIHADEQLFALQQMAEIADVYKPDAKTSPALFENINLANRIISKENAYLIQDMLKDVIRRGTGVRANRELRRRDLSGKTGTTNDYRDAWFAGFNNDLTSVVWVGKDNYDPLGSGEQGSRTALPIWIESVSYTHLTLPTILLV